MGPEISSPEIARTQDPRSRSSVRAFDRGSPARAPATTHASSTRADVRSVRKCVRGLDPPDLARAPPWGHPPSSRKFPRRSRARSSDPTGEGVALTPRRPRAERPTRRQEAHRHRPREGRQQRQGKRRRLPVPRHRRGHRLRLPWAHRSQGPRRVRRGQLGHRRRGRRQVRVQALEVLHRHRQGDRRRGVPRLRNLRALLDPLLQHLPPLLSVSFDRLFRASLSSVSLSVAATERPNDRTIPARYPS